MSLKTYILFELGTEVWFVRRDRIDATRPVCSACGRTEPVCMGWEWRVHEGGVMSVWIGGPPGDGTIHYRLLCQDTHQDNVFATESEAKARAAAINERDAIRDRLPAQAPVSEEGEHDG